MDPWRPLPQTTPKCIGLIRILPIIIAFKPVASIMMEYVITCDSIMCYLIILFDKVSPLKDSVSTYSKTKVDKSLLFLPRKNHWADRSSGLCQRQFCLPVKNTYYWYWENFLGALGHKEDPIIKLKVIAWVLGLRFAKLIFLSIFFFSQHFSIPNIYLISWLVKGETNVSRKCSHRQT